MIRKFIIDYQDVNNIVSAFVWGGGVYAHVHRDQRNSFPATQDPLGEQPVSFGRAAGALNHSAIQPPQLTFYS